MVRTHLSSVISLPSSKATGERERELKSRRRAEQTREKRKAGTFVLSAGLHRRNQEQARVRRSSGAAGARLSPGGGRPLLPLTVDGIEKSSVPEPQGVPGRQEGGMKGARGPAPAGRGVFRGAGSAHQMGCCFRWVYKYTFSTSFSSTGSHPAPAEQSKDQPPTRPLPPGLLQRGNSALCWRPRNTNSSRMQQVFLSRARRVPPSQDRKAGCFQPDTPADASYLLIWPRSPVARPHPCRTSERQKR